MMAKDTVESMIHGYNEYISKLSLESEVGLLKLDNVKIGNLKRKNRGHKKST